MLKIFWNILIFERKKILSRFSTFMKRNNLYFEYLCTYHILKGLLFHVPLTLSITESFFAHHTWVLKGFEVAVLLLVVLHNVSSTGCRKLRTRAVCWWLYDPLRQVFPFGPFWSVKQPKWQECVTTPRAPDRAHWFRLMHHHHHPLASSNSYFAEPEASRRSQTDRQADRQAWMWRADPRRSSRSSVSCSPVFRPHPSRSMSPFWRRRAVD